MFWVATQFLSPHSIDVNILVYSSVSYICVFSAELILFCLKLPWDDGPAACARGHQPYLNPVQNLTGLTYTGCLALTSGHTSERKHGWWRTAGSNVILLSLSLIPWLCHSLFFPIATLMNSPFVSDFNGYADRSRVWVIRSSDLPPCEISWWTLKW